MSAPRDLPARPRVAVAGATGFVGRALVPALAEQADVIALRRSAMPEDARSDGPVEWRRCDLFSLRETEAALAGADVAVYLVHSMLPSARLTQGRFEDLDLLLADNFGRAAASAGVRRIVYLGGLVPHGDAERAELSAHLASRLEVESALAGHGVPVTAVRAAMVVGPGGSSLDIVVKLVARLPVMVCPAWTLTPSEPIALDDVVAILVRCVEDPETLGRICEVGGPDVLSYRDLMRATARALGKRRLFLPVPLMSPGLSRLWVTLVTGTPRALVAPLVESLRHPMVAREYTSWLPHFVRPLVQVQRDGPLVLLRARGVPRPLLAFELEAARSSPERSLFAIRGGLLAGSAPAAPDSRPRLEFRATPDGAHVLAAVQDFRPRLPWWLYRLTQARLHALVMWAFGRHLARQPGAEPRVPTPTPG